jgi:hypothetical protein
LIIPTGPDAELMGTYLFAGQIITWLPPTVSTDNSDDGVSQQVGIASILIWFFLKVSCLISMGSYRNAVIAVGRGHVVGNSPIDTTDAVEQNPVTTAPNYDTKRHEIQETRKPEDHSLDGSERIVNQAKIGTT